MIGGDVIVLFERRLLANKRNKRGIYDNRNVGGDHLFGVLGIARPRWYK